MLCVLLLVGEAFLFIDEFGAVRLEMVKRLVELLAIRTHAPEAIDCVVRCAAVMARTLASFSERAYLWLVRGGVIGQSLLGRGCSLSLIIRLLEIMILSC